MAPSRPDPGLALRGRSSRRLAFGRCRFGYRICGDVRRLPAIVTVQLGGTKVQAVLWGYRVGLILQVVNQMDFKAARRDHFLRCIGPIERQRDASLTSQANMKRR